MVTPLLFVLQACTPKAAVCEPTPEVPYDGVDQDCDGRDLVDVDQDGSPSPADCDDADPARAPGATEVPGDGIDQDCDGVDAVATGTRTGRGTDSYFGAALLFDGSALLVGAPYFRVGEGAGGQVTREGEIVATGLAGDRLGRSLARLDDGTVLIGVPGVGEVRTGTGDTLATGDGVGRLLTARGDRWVTSTATGARWDDGTEVDWGGPPDALVILPDGSLVGGYAHGPEVIRLGVSGVLTRVDPSDEAGFSLASWDPRGDGRTEILVGAPAAGRVYRVDPSAPALDRPVTGTGGRFGASLAASGTAAWVGAPLEGDGAQGAVWALADAGTPLRVRTGAAEGDELGFSVAVGPGVVAAGAPGSAVSVGGVEVFAP